MSVSLTKRNNKGPRLLQKIGGRNAATPESLSRKAAVAQRKNILDLTTPVTGSIDRPPLDSGDDESPADETGKPKEGFLRNRPRRAGKGEGASVSSSQSGASGTSSIGKRARDDEGEDSSCMSSQPIGSQHSLFSSSQQSSKRLKNQGYGKQEKRYGSSQEKAQSPEKPVPKNKISNTSTLESTPNRKPKFMKFSPLPDSPEKPSNRPEFKVLPRFNSSSPERPPPKFKMPVMEFSEIEDDDSELPELPSIQARNVAKHLKRQTEEEPETPAPVFQIHDMPEFTSGKTFEQLGLKQRDLAAMGDEESVPELPDHLIECPMCREPVEKAFLEEFSEEYCRGERLTVASQTRFCDSHKKRSAMKDWASRGYPDIDWDTLSTRIRGHYRYLDSLLEPNTPSFYRDEMNELLQSSSRTKVRVKSIIHNGGSITPGYYGMRGSRIMSENIMRRFAPKLRLLAKKDDLVFAQGVAPFIQTVLVSELAARLIKEDMKVSIEEARNILKESATVGDLLQEELDEVVRDEGDDS